jgi:hypothetical protein
VFDIAEPNPNKLSKPTEALAIEQSTAASIFWTLDQMKEMAAELATAGTYLISTSSSSQ